MHLQGQFGQLNGEVSLSGGSRVAGVVCTFILKSVYQVEVELQGHFGQ